MSNETFLAPLEYRCDELVIRAYRPGDGAALQRSVVASYQHLRPWMPWARPEQSVEESEVLCRTFLGKYLLNQEFTMGIWRGDELVGGTGYMLRWGPLEQGNAEVGMWIAASCAGQGMGTRVLGALLEWGFAEWPWQRLVWLCDTRNLASARVAQKCGLRREATFHADGLGVEGERRDTHLFAILRSEYQVKGDRPLDKVTGDRVQGTGRGH